MNLPNKLTTARAAVIPFFLAAMLGKWPAGWHYPLALALFAAAALTDRLDGKIARERNQITDFGKFMDPLADKLLVVSALVCLLADGLASPWAVLIVIAREFMVTGLRLVAVEDGRVIAANRWGKAKTVLQILAVCAVLALQSALELGAAAETSAAAFSACGQFLIWVAAAFTAVSGAVYIGQNIDLFRGAK